jgi:hypothetical protein
MSHRFSDLYIDQVFHIWYETGKPGMKRLGDLIPADGENKPNKLTLDSWKSEYGWEERADALDGEASSLLDQEVIQRRIKMWENLETVGNEILEKGREYLKRHDFDDAVGAIRAVVEGSKLVQASVGQAQAWAKIGQMTDAQLNAEIRKLLGKGTEGGVMDLSDAVDGEEIDTESGDKTNDNG